MGKEKSYVYFLGICGVAMGSVAIALSRKGYYVKGSDAEFYPPISELLNGNKIPFFRGFDPNHLYPKPDIVIVGNSISRGNPELEEVLCKRMYYLSLPEFLKNEFLYGKENIVITGTHGKTTTTALVSWILEIAGLKPNFLIGGLPKNFDVGCRFTDSDWFVIEGDEYDSSFADKRSKFLHYLPTVLVINNIEFDHADIFPDIHTIKMAFGNLIRLVPSNGLIIYNADQPDLLQLLNSCRCKTYSFGLSSLADIHPENWKQTLEGIFFEFEGYSFTVPLYGEHNLRNVMAAIGVAKHCGISFEIIRRALMSFKGVSRRLELISSINNIYIFDDFAHHPTAIWFVIKTLRERFPSSRIIIAFEPRSNTTRRKIFQDDLAKSLALADISFIAPVHRADRLDPNERLDVDKLAQQIINLGRQSFVVKGYDDLVNIMKDIVTSGDVICFCSNGNFGGCPQKLADILRRRYQKE